MELNSALFYSLTFFYALLKIEGPSISVLIYRLEDVLPM